jgi:ribosomal protein S18 acetylase RimI-like enzyme
MRIRSAVLSDLAQVVACEDLAFPRRDLKLRVRGLKPNSNLEPKIREGSVHVMGPPGRVLGYISFSANPDHLFVDAIGVLPELQGRGLGSQLLAFAETMTLQLRLPSLRLFTDGSIANHRFYRRRGYRETDRCEDGSFLRVYYMKNVTPHAQVAEACR